MGALSLGRALYDCSSAVASLGIVGRVTRSYRIHEVIENMADGFDASGPAPQGGGGSGGSWTARAPSISWLALLVPVAILLVGAWSYRWVQDDAFINFRIITNLLAGNGPVFNVGERVEVYSDPLWLFVLAVLHEVTPFLPIESLAVWLGLGGTAIGTLLGGRAVQRLGGSRGDGLVLPLGLLIFSVVAGVWEFSTSGLEMGLVFAWIGSSSWLLVRVERRRTSALACAFVVGLGALIRPELALMCGVYLVALGMVVRAPGWCGPIGFWRRYVLPLVAALGLPLVYEAWRMAYFAMMVANTALAKSAGSSRWTQGLDYLQNFVLPYALWIPALLLLPLAVPRIDRWWRTGDRLGVLVLLTPVLAGAADALYVVTIGGDYMHARLLLPAFFAWCLFFYVDIRQLRSILLGAVAGIVIWSICCAGWLRFDVGASSVIVDERSFWVFVTGRPHPITASDYRNLTDPGLAYASQARRQSAVRRQVVLVVPDEVAPSRGSEILPARSQLPFHVAANMTNIGAIALAAGPDVYIFDSLSLANPIGSHTTVAVRGRPGHEKYLGPAWMIGRFGLPGDDVSSSVATRREISAARAALRCQPLSTYLHAITAPLTIGQVFSNVFHSVTYTTMQFSPDPLRAERQLCH